MGKTRKKPVVEDLYQNRAILSEGLVSFYSSQAQLLLSQYSNIVNLLGPTTHWTPTGTLCEELLKGFLRRSLFSYMSVDKGYIYGRRPAGSRSTPHCPEVDLLIHDTRQFQPIYRTGDFVIVRPEAVLGIIQVKKNLTIEEMEDGLKNVMEAKQFLADVMPCHPFYLRGDHPNQEPSGFWCQPVFSAVVGFEGKLAKKIEAFRSIFDAWRDRYETYNLPNHAPTSCYVLPTYVGSLEGRFVLCDNFRAPCSRGYQIYQSFAEDGINIALQALLSAFFEFTGVKHVERPPFAYPPHLRPIGMFSVSTPTTGIPKG